MRITPTEKKFLFILGIITLITSLIILILLTTEDYHIKDLGASVISALFAGIVVALLVEALPILIRAYS